MARSMSPEREKEYEELHAFLDFYATHVRGIDPNDGVNLTNVVKEIVQRFGKSKALDGLRQAANDTVEELSNQPPEFISRLDVALRQAGIITVSEVRRRYAAAYKRILRCGAIKGETEYYIIAGVAADMDASVSNEERAQLESLLSNYRQT